eukprot:CAMPEP_0206469592 /NCGR_PEP_ID=MMETSP0324_2-20121206/30377_1 /ASSEMBLY_ACC=CAM_ASM_000836 /TAXON_ID=2866 /ORGANISM="Crypthecodinium cohnii, Strain Seligo" /LENGTH=141 /DNA_ID=CAMNT_0053943391 /DNA_START=164 /DNA_END=590 /DNA_ORIENTATION=-
MADSAGSAASAAAAAPAAAAASPGPDADPGRNGSMFDEPSERPLQALPPPSEEPEAQSAARDEVQEVVVGGVPVKLDKLGPVVVGNKGEISRISNWHEMTEAEQKQTLLVIGKRNQQRLARLKAEAAQTEETAKAETEATP